MEVYIFFDVIAILHIFLTLQYLTMVSLTGLEL